MKEASFSTLSVRMPPAVDEQPSLLEELVGELAGDLGAFLGHVKGYACGGDMLWYASSTGGRTTVTQVPAAETQVRPEMVITAILLSYPADRLTSIAGRWEANLKERYGETRIEVVSDIHAGHHHHGNASAE